MYFRRRKRMQKYDDCPLLTIALPALLLLWSWYSKPPLSACLSLSPRRLLQRRRGHPFQQPPVKNKMIGDCLMTHCTTDTGANYTENAEFYDNLTQREKDFLALAHSPLNRASFLERLEQLGLLSAYLLAERGTSG